MKNLVVLFSFFFLHLSFVKAQSGFIITVAGNGDRTANAFSGDGGSAINAELGALGNLVFDTSGNYYIDDLGNGRIRKVTKATGIINTIIGGGHNTWSGNSISDTDAILTEPGGIAIDDSGNIYISEGYENVVFKVGVNTQIISVVAGTYGVLNKGGTGDGGHATSALLNNGFGGVTVDDTGNLYIADCHNSKIRKVRVVSGIITTVVGNGSPGYHGDGGLATNAELNAPYALTFDKSGNMYIADNANNVIRKVTKATGIITTVAGDGIGGYSGDGSAATSAEIWVPTGVTIDDSANIYIGDNENNVIRKVTSAGIISTIIGNGVSNYTGDGGPASDAELRYPNSITFDALGNIYVSDAGNYVVRKVTYNPLGINNLIQPNAIKVYPNPTKGVITFEFNKSINGFIDLYDVKGSLVLHKQITNSVESIDCSGLTDSVYLYKVADEKGNIEGEGKVVIQK